MLNKKSIASKKAGISYLEMFLLITAIFSFSYIIYSMESVDAAQYGDVCCEKTKTGESCQMESAENCDSDFRNSPTDCESTEYCKVGCCISKENGICNRMTPKAECTNGTFQESPMCNMQECTKGCCFFEDDTKWTTEKNCEFIGNSKDKELTTEWLFDESHNSELECIFSTEKGIKSACVYETEEGKRKCIYTTLEECVVRTGEESSFDMEGRFCSDSYLNTSCEARDHKGCVEDKEDVYWFDSCNNSEEISEECDLYGGSYCGKVDGEYKCKDVNCIIDGVNRKNGESWCEYDGTIGNGKDPVGSRHIRHLCYMGTERIDPCQDFRNEICVEERTEVEGAEFSEATCRVNQWRTCLDLNRYKGSEKMVEKCDKNPDCWVKEIDMGGSFHFKVCLPEYPPGFDFLRYDEESEEAEQSYYTSSSAEAICSAATVDCQTTWRCCLLTGCVCIDNCDCHTKKFTQEMNDFCTSLGDCGAYVNYVGTFSDGGYSVRADKNTPPRIDNSFSQYAEPNPEQAPAKPGNAEFIESFAPELMQIVTDSNGNNQTLFEKELLAVAGALGSPLLLKMLAERGEDEINLTSNLLPDSIGFAGYSNGAGTTQAGVSSQIVYQNKEMKDMSALIAMIAGLIASIVAYAITQSIMVAFIAAFLAAMIAMLFAMCWIEYHHVYFSCMPWEAPSDGKDCNECNQLESPCTKYRCESLGELCEFVNEGTGKELCVDKPENSSYPVIEPLYSSIAEGYEYYNVKDDGFEIVKSDGKGCIEAFATVDMGIKVSPFARCKIGSEPTQDYEEMSELFGPRGSMILPIHKMGLYFPSPDAFKNMYNLTDAQVEQLSKINYYVKCKTASGKVNPKTYTIKTCIDPGPDLTAPRVKITDPKNEAPIKYNQDELSLKVYINEPAECRWSKEDKNYDEMESVMKCDNDLANMTLFGFACSTKLTGLLNNSDFYFKCRDQPWLAGEDEESRNTMAESYKYSVKTSEEILVIDEFKPSEDEVMTEDHEPVSVTLKLSTSGGVNDGRAECWWKGNGYSDRFTETNSTVHSYTMTSAMRGDYKIYFECEDEAGNTANSSTNFRIEVDNFGPKIIRFYYDGSLKVVTNEEGECRYSFDSSTKFENATIMGSFGKEHYAEWQLRDYYIQCQDKYENKGGKTVIKAYQIVS